MYPRNRMEAFSDAIFSVSMTLLVLDVRLPDDFQPRDAGDLVAAIVGLFPKFFPYALSFLVLGIRWLSQFQHRTNIEAFDRGYAKWWLLHLFLVTCVPFTTIVVGRFASLAPSIWLYAGNTALIGLVSLVLLRHTPHADGGGRWRERHISQAMLVLSSLAAIAVSFYSPRGAFWALSLNAVAPAISRWWMRRATSPPGAP